MADARGSTATVRLSADLAADGLPESVGRRTTAVFGASGTVITFRGFLAAYEEGRDAERYDDDGRSRGAQRDERLPAMAEGDMLAGADLTADGHRTSPPPRYTEASLVKALEERGIGRPSTYAATISVIQDRGYVTSRGQALVPSWLAFAVTRLLEENFDHLVDYDFTAAMETDLDAIAAGEKERVAWLTEFYFGTGDDVGPARPGRRPRRDRRAPGQLHPDRRGASRCASAATARTSRAPSTARTGAPRCPRTSPRTS